MIRTIFILQIICLAIAFIDVGITGANSYYTMNAPGKICCIAILVGFAIQFGIMIVSIFRNKRGSE